MASERLREAQARVEATRARYTWLAAAIGLASLAGVGLLVWGAASVGTAGLWAWFKEHWLALVVLWFVWGIEGRAAASVILLNRIEQRLVELEAAVSNLEPRSRGELPEPFMPGGPGGPPEER